MPRSVRPLFVSVGCPLIDVGISNMVKREFVRLSLDEAVGAGRSGAHLVGVVARDQIRCQRIDLLREC